MTQESPYVDYPVLTVEDLEARWKESLANVHRVVLLDRPKVCRIVWCGEIIRGQDGWAWAAAAVYVTSFKEPGDPVEVALPVILCQETPQDAPYAYVPWQPLKDKTPRFYARGDKFGGFDTLDNRREVLQVLLPGDHRKKPRTWGNLRT